MNCSTFLKEKYFLISEFKQRSYKAEILEENKDWMLFLRPNLYDMVVRG